MNRLNKKRWLLLLCMGSSCIGMDRFIVSSSTSDDVNALKNIPMGQDSRDVFKEALESSVSINLLKSIECGNVASVRSIIKTHPNIVRQLSGQALHYAIKRSQTSCVALLLTWKANFNALTPEGDAPLHVAKTDTMVRLLLRHGALIEQKNNKGETPFFTAIKKHYFDIAHLLCAGGANVNACDYQGDGPLHHAVMDLDIERIKFLLYRGSDINSPNKKNETAYQLAERQGGKILKAFQEYKNVYNAINTIEDNTGLTIMKLLADNGKKLRKLLAPNVSGYCSSGIAIVSQLLQKCTDTVWNELSSEFSPYSLESLSLLKLVKNRSIHRRCFIELLDANQFVKARDLLKINPYLLHTYNGEYSRDLASAIFIDKFISTALNHKYHYIRDMLYYAFDVDSCNELGVPLLSLVIQQPESGKKYLDLLKIGAQVNTKDCYGNTPLFYATQRGDEAIVMKLLLYGAVVNRDLWQKISPQYPKIWVLISNGFEGQACISCETHACDLSNIPCVNRHLGHFICADCYSVAKSCPLCRRMMGVFGS